MRLELGVGEAPREGAVGLDIRPPADVVADLRSPLPFADGSFVHVYAEQVLEHIPGPDQYRLWNEVHRVLSPGGTFEGWVPGLDLHLDFAVRDPTHVFFFTAGTWRYLLGERGTDEADHAFHDGRTAEWHRPQVAAERGWVYHFTAQKGRKVA